MVDIQQQDGVPSLPYRHQRVQAELKPTTVIEPSKRVEHAQTIQGLPLFQQFIHQSLSKLIVSSLNDMLNSNTY